MKTASRLLCLTVLCGISAVSFAQLQKPPVPPRVVAQISETGLTKTVLKTLFIPQEDGLFRLSVYVLGTAGTGEGNLLFYVYSVDDVGPAQQAINFGAPVGCNGVCSYTVVIRAKAGTKIRWESIPTRTKNPNLTYDVFGTLEKLQPLD